MKTRGFSSWTTPERCSINRLLSLTEAAVDASSIIYMLKAGFLGLLGHTIRLLTIDAIRDETGWQPPEVEIRPEPALDCGGPGPGADEPSNDERLLRFAVAFGLPVISEDRGLLEEAGRRGLDYYNSLMMLLLLRYRGRIDEDWYTEARNRLVSIGRYSDEVLRRFDALSRELGP